MRIDIKTAGVPVICNDIRALYLIQEAMKISTPRMRMANLRFIEFALLRGEYDKPSRGKKEEA